MMLNRIRTSLPVHPTLRHPRTGERLRAVGVLGGRPVWPVMGAEDDPPKPEPDPKPDPPKPDPPKPEDRGYPLGTPVAEMTAEQQAAYWKYQSRKHEDRVKEIGDVDELRKKAARADELEAATATDTEKAVKKAREEGVAEGQTKAAPGLVKAWFHAAAKGVLTDTQRDALLEDLDLSKYLTDKGEVDIEKVTAKVAAFAPADEGKGGKFPDLGQGRRGKETTRKGSAGAAEAEKRFGKQTTTQ